MAGFQFIREECFSKLRSQAAPTGKVGVARAQGGGRSGARDVIAEAIRDLGAAPHVESPAPPICLYGKKADELMTWYDQVEAKAAAVRSTTKAGVVKKQRDDVPILMGVVASYPGPADEQDKLYVAWREKTVEYLRDRYGDQLASVLEHRDELHGHIHALVSNDGKTVKPLQSGFSAMEIAAQSGATKKEQSRAYQEGGRAFQNDYFERVASRVGLARLGPKKRRLTRAQWLAEQLANRAIAAAHASAEAAQKRVEAAKSAVREDAQKVDQRARLVSAQETRVKAAEVAVRAEIPKIAAAEIALKNEAIERQKRIDAERKISVLSRENSVLADDKNVLHNEVISLKRALKKSAPE